MTLINPSELLMLAMDSHRSRIYLQLLHREKLLPAQILLLTSEEPLVKEQMVLKQRMGLKPSDLNWIREQYDLDLSPDTLALCQTYGLKTTMIHARNINDAKVYQFLKTAEQPFVLFSARGIVRKPLLSLSQHFIHVHPGELPAYKGSTVPYYMMLNQEKKLCMSVLTLDQGIDTGTVLYSTYFSIPGRLDLFDFFYDPFLRACALRDFLLKCRSGVTPELHKAQSEIQTSRGETYHIIHPVLKHLAILKHMKKHE